MSAVFFGQGRMDSFLDSLFTATSATCVTGLVVVDTYTHWSFVGQLIIILLIQIGGLGFMTVMTMFTIFMHKRISLHKRRLLMQSAGYVQLNGVTTLIRKILRGTLLFEGAGALILATRFCPKMGFADGFGARFSILFQRSVMPASTLWGGMGSFLPL